MIPRRNHSGETMRLGKLAFTSSSLLIALSTSIPTLAQAAQNAAPTAGEGTRVQQRGQWVDGSRGLDCGRRN